MSLEEFLTNENQVLKHSLEQFKEEVAAYDLFEFIMKELNKSIDEMPEKEKDVLVSFSIMSHIIHTNLRLSLVLILRGHYIESFMTLRPAIEMTSHIYKMSLSPKENAVIWLRQEDEEFKKQYTSLYEHNKFPKDIGMMNPLKDIYEACCNYGSHSTVYAIVNKTGQKIEEKKIIQHLYNIDINDETWKRHLIYILHCMYSVLVVFDAIFPELINAEKYKPVKAVVEMFNSKVESLKSSYREWKKINKPES